MVNLSLFANSFLPFTCLCRTHSLVILDRAWVRILVRWCPFSQRAKFLIYYCAMRWPRWLRAMLAHRIASQCIAFIIIIEPLSHWTDEGLCFARTHTHTVSILNSIIEQRAIESVEHGLFHCAFRHCSCRLVGFSIIFFSHILYGGGHFGNTDKRECADEMERNGMEGTETVIDQQQMTEQGKGQGILCECGVRAPREKCLHRYFHPGEIYTKIFHCLCARSMPNAINM